MARGLLLRGSVFIHLDPRAEGVVVPPHFARQPQLVLQIGLDMAVPIPDLRVDEEGIYGTLSFNRSPFTVMVPWDAVFALADDQGRAMVWPDSLPDELRAEVEREMGLRPPAGLRVVPGEKDDEPGAAAAPGRRPERVTRAGSVEPVTADEADEPVAAEEPAGGTSRPLPPYLRVVK